MMKHAAIYCTQPVRGTLFFFVRAEGKPYYLFAQPFRTSLWNRYRFSVLLDDALDRAKCSKPDRSVCDKLFKAISYVEKECGVTVFRRSRENPDAEPSRKTRADRRREPSRRRERCERCERWDDENEIAA